MSLMFVDSVELSLLAEKGASKVNCVLWDFKYFPRKLEYPNGEVNSILE